jgi:hypothetical protein
MIHARWARWPFVVGVALVAASCGGRPPTEEEVSAVFARIQVAEARLVVAAEQARAPELACDDRRRASEAGCGAAAALCEDAGTIEDADAMLRCDRGRAICDELRASVQASCEARPV